jgi:hypothetical protein
MHPRVEMAPESSGWRREACIQYVVLAHRKGGVHGLRVTGFLTESGPEAVYSP